MNRRGAHERAKTHCPHGHPYDAANTHVNTQGARVCRACLRRRARYGSPRKTTNATTA